MLYMRYKLIKSMAERRQHKDDKKAKEIAEVLRKEEKSNAAQADRAKLQSHKMIANYNKIRVEREYLNKDLEQVLASLRLTH